ncbi:MAG: phosphatase PAP2 family protein [Bdellovibrionales bacterium]
MRCLLFNIILLFSLSGFASFYDLEVRPVLNSGFDSAGVGILASTIALVGTLKGTDSTHLKDIQSKVNLNSDWNDLGDFLGTGAAGMFAVGIQYWVHEDISYSRNHLRTLIWTGASTVLLKGVLQRERPYGGEHSMPSGHTSTIFATATSLTYSYGWKAALIAYPLALLTAVQRIDENKHWPSDVIAGAALGVFWGRAIHNSFSENYSFVFTPNEVLLTIYY